MSLSNIIKKNTFLYIAIKSNFNPKKIANYYKDFKEINELELIDLNSYLELHPDAKALNPVAHYLFYGYKDQNKNYLNPLYLSDYITNQEVLAKYLVSNKPVKTDKLRIAVFMNDPFADLAPCPYIRIHYPFKHLAGEFKFFIYGAESYNLVDISQIIESKLFDVVVVQRILPFLDILKEKCLKHNIKIIYETDDDLLGVEENSPSFEYVDRVRDELIDFINTADLITVSTTELAKRFSNSVVIKNYHLKEILNVKGMKKSGKLKLGYYGTLTHSKDLFLIKNVILKLKEKYDFDFEVIGGFNAEDNVSENWFKAIDLPKNNMNFELFMGWLSKNTDWDIAIVPLEDSYFNKGKSELKYIELAILGMPAVFSDMSVYNSVVKDGFNGFLASSDEIWFNKIEKLILNKQLRVQIRDNALEDVLSNYNEEIIFNKWREIFNDIK